MLPIWVWFLLLIDDPWCSRPNVAGLVIGHRWARWPGQPTHSHL